ncbi:hypothetical protein AX769_01030 [Frondihabitans sp. PAMC 28766]|uniref:helix-turn-helix transcriptional regulator n=1 Tax=Frondihabitans sp. PAMC 28766 TaxID=1795630 RepID=UPI00078DA4B3|nr:AraC family transcriptional regulator [Frondihabitans sp. PAMC 28766]AMM18979.1 hypothetical protein AX769_01030 [Frondihabitans sp. PAMC 28766]
MITPVFSTMEANRPDEAAEAIRRGFGYQVALSAGDLSYRQRVIVGDTVAASDLHLGATLSLDLDPTDEFMFVELHSGTYAYNPWGRDEVIGSGGSFVMPPEQSMHFRIDHADVSTVSFSAQTLRETAQAVFDVDETVLTEGAVGPRDRGRAWLWQQTVKAYRRDVLEAPDVYGHDLLRAEATRYLVMSAISAFGLVDEPDRHASGSAAIKRAIAYIDEHRRSPLTVQDIASAARLSQRGLLLAFRRERGLAPMQYVRAARLAGARSDLLTADPTRGDTVADIAACWGFTNPGRFANHYRIAYGESPRDTLAH